MLTTILIVAVGCGDRISETQKHKILESQIQKLKDVRVKKFGVTECLTDCYRESILRL